VAYEWLVDGLEETWSSLTSLLAHQPEEAFLKPTPCPGWSVKDIVSHLYGFEQMLSGESAPAVEGDFADYVKNPIGELNEAYVLQGRRLSGAASLALFKEVSARSLNRLRALSEEEWETVGWSPEGDRPYHRFMETRILDSWIHLQDIRDALLEPADDHGVGEEVVLNRFEAALPFVLGKRVSPPDGTLVQLNLSGRLARVIFLKVHDGRAQAVAMTEEMPDLELTTPVALFWRRCAGRISADAFLSASATDVRGSKSLATALAEGLAIMI